MVDPSLLLIRGIAGAAMVLIVTALAERAGPRVAGVLMAFPTMTAINLHFIGLSHDATFAAESATWNPVGLTADVFFVLAYVACCRLAVGNSRRTEVAIALIGALAVLVSSVWTLEAIAPTAFMGRLALLAFAIGGLAFLTRNIPDNSTATVAKGALVPRALFAGLVVAGVTLSADMLGPAWGGLLSAFPGTILPVLVLLHLAHGHEVTDSVVKHSWSGFSSTGVYAFMVANLYPVWGVWAGTATSLAGATLVALVLNLARR